MKTHSSVFFLSSTGEQKTVQSNAQMNVQANQKVEFQVKEPSTVDVTEGAHTKDDPAEATQEDTQKKLLVKDNSHQPNPTLTAADNRLKTSEEPVDILLQEGRQVNKIRFKTTDHIRAVSANLSGDAKIKKKQDVMNGAANGEDSALMRGHAAADVNNQRSLCGSTTEGKAKEGSWVDGKPVGTHLSVHMSPPIIKLEPLGLKVSCDEMQSMEIR